MPSSPRRAPPAPLDIPATRSGSGASTPSLGRYSLVPSSEPSPRPSLDGYTSVTFAPADGPTLRSRSGSSTPDYPSSSADGKSKMDDTKLLLGDASSGLPSMPATPISPLPPYSPPRLTPPPAFSPTFSRRGSGWGFVPASVATGGRSERVRVLWVLIGLVAGAVIGWQFAREGKNGAAQVSHVPLVPETIPGRCDPYAASRPGHLELHPTSYSHNRWVPLDDGLPACEPINWMDRLRRSGQRDLGGLSSAEAESLAFLRGKSVVTFGDSVDRDMNEHFCEFVGGKFDMVHAGDPISPPYPQGQERPSGEGMRYNLKHLEGNRWPDFGQSRPYVCRVERLNFTTLSVFHYGFTEENDWLRNSPHFYPPSALEARFTGIVQPLITSLFGPAGPTVFSVSGGFWDIMRQIKIDEARADELAAAGRLTPAVEAALGPWTELSKERRSWFEKKYERFLRGVVDAWGGKESETRIVWRALHQPRPFNNAPKNRVAVVDAIGRGVVAKLVNQDATKGPSEESLGLKDRVYVTNWGKMIAGYEFAFRDDIHPMPMPSSWLAWNILLEQVKVQDELVRRKHAKQ
ncbi:hypothetical protein JCM10207_005497 [Rhodosporidiobolus poonsookiae]